MHVRVKQCVTGNAMAKSFLFSEATERSALLLQRDVLTSENDAKQIRLFSLFSFTSIERTKRSTGTECKRSVSQSKDMMLSSLFCLDRFDLRPNGFHSRRVLLKVLYRLLNMTQSAVCQGTSSTGSTFRLDDVWYWISNESTMGLLYSRGLGVRRCPKDSS